MSSPTRQNLEIRRGNTFEVFAYWGSEPFRSVGIQSVTLEPFVRFVTKTAHGLTAGWPVARIGLVGPEQLNAASNPPSDADFYHATIIDSTTVELNGYSGSGMSRHTPGSGFLVWYTPKSLAGKRARMDIRPRPGGPLLLSLTSDVDGGIVLDDTNKVIRLRQNAALTEALAKPGVYDIEIADEVDTDDVETIFEGSIKLAQQVTTTP